MSLAEEMTDAHTKAVMVGIDQGYEKIANWLEEPVYQPTWPTAISRTSLCFKYQCADTGFRVESFLSTNPSNALYEEVACVACGRTHSIDPTTGNVLGEKSPANVTDGPAA